MLVEIVVNPGREVDVMASKVKHETIRDALTRIFHEGGRGDSGLGFITMR